MDKKGEQNIDVTEPSVNTGGEGKGGVSIDTPLGIQPAPHHPSIADDDDNEYGSDFETEQNIHEDKKYESDFENEPNQDDRASSKSSRSSSTTSITSGSKLLVGSTSPVTKVMKRRSSGSVSYSSKKSDLSRSSSESSVSGTNVSNHEVQTEQPRNNTAETVDRSNSTTQTTTTVQEEVGVKEDHQSVDTEHTTHDEGVTGRASSVGVPVDDAAGSPSNDAELKQYLQNVLERANEFFLGDRGQVDENVQNQSDSSTLQGNNQENTNNTIPAQAPTESAVVNSNSNASSSDRVEKSFSEVSLSVSQSSSSGSVQTKGGEGRGGESAELPSVSKIENGRVSRFGMRPVTDQESKSGNETSSNDDEGDNNKPGARKESESENMEHGNVELENGNQAIEDTNNGADGSVLDSQDNNMVRIISCINFSKTEIYTFLLISQVFLRLLRNQQL